MLSAPQLGVRHTRRMVGVGRISRYQFEDPEPSADEIGISPSLSPRLPVVSVPYGCLVPRSLDGLLVAGRHISCDPSAHSFMREIPQCWMTGQAAGTAAGLAAECNVAPRSVPLPDLQASLLRQGVVLRPQITSEPPIPSAVIQ